MFSGFPDYGCNIDGMCASYSRLLNLPSVKPITKELEFGTLKLGWKCHVRPRHTLAIPNLLESHSTPLMHGVVAAHYAYGVFGAISAQLSQMIHRPSSVE